MSTPTVAPSSEIREEFFTEAQWARTSFPPEYRPRAFRMGYCTIFVAQEPTPIDRRLRWHLSIAHPWRLPTWEEIKRARTELLPAEKHFVVPMPPERFWISVHNFCMHLWEVADKPLTKQWESERG